MTRVRTRTRVRLEFGGLGLESSIFKWTQTRLESKSQMNRTRLESFNGWTRSNTDYRYHCAQHRSGHLACFHVQKSWAFGPRALLESVRVRLYVG